MHFINISLKWETTKKIALRLPLFNELPALVLHDHLQFYISYIVQLLQLCWSFKLTSPSSSSNSIVSWHNFNLLFIYMWLSSTITTLFVKSIHQEISSLCPLWPHLSPRNIHDRLLCSPIHDREVVHLVTCSNTGHNIIIHVLNKSNVLHCNSLYLFKAQYIALFVSYYTLFFRLMKIIFRFFLRNVILRKWLS